MEFVCSPTRDMLVCTFQITKQTRQLSINQYLHISEGKRMIINPWKGTTGLPIHKGRIHRAPNPITKQVEESPKFRRELQDAAFQPCTVCTNGQNRCPHSTPAGAVIVERFHLLSDNTTDKQTKTRSKSGMLNIPN